MEEFRPRDLAVIVADESHPNFGMIGKIIWFPPGGCEDDILIRLAGGNEIQIDVSNLFIYYRKADYIGLRMDSEQKSGPMNLAERYIEIGGKMEDMLKEYRTLFEEEFRIPDYNTSSNLSSNGELHN